MLKFYYLPMLFNFVVRFLCLLSLEFWRWVYVKMQLFYSKVNKIEYVFQIIAISGIISVVVSFCIVQNILEWIIINTTKNLTAHQNCQSVIRWTCYTLCLRKVIHLSLLGTETKKITHQFCQFVICWICYTFCLRKVMQLRLLGQKLSYIYNQLQDGTL